MLVLQCQIEISCTKVVKFNYVTSIEVKKSIKSFTGTATVTVPRKLKFEDKNLLDYIKAGDKITIGLGYKKHTLQTVFKGYIKSIKNAAPIVIECEDEAYKLKQVILENIYFDNFTINDFVKQYCSQYNCKMSEWSVGKMRVNGKMSVAGVFGYLSEKFPLQFFFREDTLYGEKFGEILTDSKVITLTRGSNIIGDDLKYIIGDDVKVAVTAKVWLKTIRDSDTQHRPRLKAVDMILKHSIIRLQQV